MALKALPTPEQLRQLLRYEPETGKLFWLHRPTGTNGCSESGRLKFNSNFAGKEALTGPNGNGYLRGVVLGTRVYAHRVAWAIQHGEWPVEHIDHINGIRSDNRIANLRSVSLLENNRNVSRRATNTSGATGVCFHKPRGKWHVRIGSKHIGLFETKEAAIEARKQAEAERGFHKNHGSART